MSTERATRADAGSLHGRVKPKGAIHKKDVVVDRLGHADDAHRQILQADSG